MTGRVLWIVPEGFWNAQKPPLVSSAPEIRRERTVHLSSFRLKGRLKKWLVRCSDSSYAYASAYAAPLRLASHAAHTPPAGGGVAANAAACFAPHAPHRATPAVLTPPRGSDRSVAAHISPASSSSATTTPAPPALAALAPAAHRRSDASGGAPSSSSSS